MFKTSNPILNEKSFMAKAAAVPAEGLMTVKGTVNKTIILTLIVAASSVWSWANVGTTAGSIWMIVGVIGGLITALISVFSPKSTPVTAPLYAAFEGLFLGAISAMYEATYGGIIFQAVTLTIGVLFTMLFLYRSGIIKVTEKFRMGVVAATGGIFLMYLINMVLGFFGMSFLHMENASMFMIGLSLFIVGIAALNLVLDFDFIDRASAAGAPKFMEWYGAFGLMVTLIWLYLEILRLLSMLNRR